MNMQDSRASYSNFEASITKRFGAEKQLTYFLRQMRMSFEFAASYSDLVGFNSGASSLILQKSKKTSDTARFGYVSWLASESERHAIWEQLKTHCHANGITKLIGPIQGATYFPYQIIAKTDGQAFFKGEFFSEPGEHQCFMAFGPSKTNYYRSAFREHFEGIMNVSKPYHDKLTENGLNFKVYQSVQRDTFSQLMQLVGEIFGSNWAFTNLDPDAFEQIFKEEANQGNRMSLHEIKMNEALIGFIRYLENDPETLICKTMGIKPEFQKQGIGNAAVYQMHEEALRQSYKKMIYALVYVGNRVQNMPDDDAVIFREYATYEYAI